MRPAATSSSRPSSRRSPPSPASSGSSAPPATPAPPGWPPSATPAAPWSSPDVITGMAYFEWGIADDVDPTDLDAVAAAHPGNGYTLRRQALADAAVQMKPGEFARAYGNRWTGAAERVIPAMLWNRARDESTPIPARGQLALAFDVGVGGRGGGHRPRVARPGRGWRMWSWLDVRPGLGLAAAPAGRAGGQAGAAAGGLRPVRPGGGRRRRRRPRRPGPARHVPPTSTSPRAPASTTRSSPAPCGCARTRRWTPPRPRPRAGRWGSAGRGAGDSPPSRSPRWSR